MSRTSIALSNDDIESLAEDTKEEDDVLAVDAQSLTPSEKTPPPSPTPTPKESSTTPPPSPTPSVPKPAPEPKVEKEVEVPQTVSFEVRTPSGKKYMLNDVHLETTVQEVKEMVAKQDPAYGVNTVRLIKTGKGLDNPHQTLGELGVKDGSVLHMVKKLTGGNATRDPTGKVGIDLKQTEAQDRGYITIRIPENARPGMKLTLTPPGRTDRMLVVVPANHGPGDIIRVRLPPERGAGGNQRSQTSQSNNAATQRTQGRSQQRTAAGPLSSMLKVQCPAGVRPGSDIQVNVPGRGRMKVKVPETTVPGEYFYFRVLAPNPQTV